MKKSILIASLLFPMAVFGIVDMRSAGYSKTFIDFNMEEQGYPLKIERTYNSRSLYNGLFGFGWCSNLETRLSVLPDDSIKIVECGGGKEVLYYPRNKKPDVNFIVNSILKEMKKRKVRLSGKSYRKLKDDLLESQTLRTEFLEALNLRGQTKKGIKYYAQGRFNEYIVVTSSGGHIRQLPNGVKESFDKQGRLVKSAEQESHIEISWEDKQIQVLNEKGKRLIFLLSSESNKIASARFGRKEVGKYTHKGDNLVKAKNSYGETFEHSYDNFNNLVKNIYSDKTTEELSYNVKKDWVVGFKDRKNCREKYEYGINKQNPDHYFSHVEKKCGRKVVNKSKYEFWHKEGAKGGKYLHRARATVNGRLKTDAIYHPVFGTPVSFLKDGVRTSRKYYNNGFLKEKDSKYQNVKYSKYNQQCRKPELVNVGYKNPRAKDKEKFVRQESIRFKFNAECQLIQAFKSDDEWIKVQYDSKGRIVLMEDQSRKRVTLTWHRRFNKPEVITRAGMGSIKVLYDSKGSVVDFKGLKSSPTVITQVTSVFNSFLATLAPVAGEIVIL